MYGYFDESIVTINGKKYCFLGFIVYRKKCTEKIIHFESSKAKYFLQNKQDIDCKNIKILYDRVSYRIEKQEIYNKFTFVKDFCMANSKREPGLQHADWIAGGASFTFKQKNQDR